MNNITKRVLSGMSGDGFNERKSYIDVHNDMNRKMNSDFDNSLSKMRISENKPDVETVDTNNYKKVEEPSQSDTSKLKGNIEGYQTFRRQNINNSSVFKK